MSRDAGVERALAELRCLGTSSEWGWFGLRRPGPTAAFSRRDTLADGFEAAAAAATRHGFVPLIRPVGGRLAAYHSEALVLDVYCRHPRPRDDVTLRFADFAAAVARGLRSVGVDARVGEVPGEYCPGRFSVNARGRTKIVGTAQRLAARSFLFSAVVLVRDPEPVRAVLTETYALLGLDWDDSSVGCVADEVRGASVDDVARVLLDVIADVVPLAARPGLAGSGDASQLARIPLRASWGACP